MIGEYVRDIHALGGTPPKDYQDDPYDMQIAELDDRLRKLIAEVERLDRKLTKMNF